MREEIDAIGGQEMLMPVLHPAEPWQRTGRYAIDELFKLQDRRGAEMVLAMTHEEVVTVHVAAAVRSYRDLPLILYHFQVKERDEPRPRAGVLRTREFIMKDSYTFDRDPEGLDAPTRSTCVAYDRMLDRCGLEWYRVESDVGMMGGLGAHEYMAPCAAARTTSRWPPATPPTSRSPPPTPSRSRCRRAGRARGGRHARDRHRRRRRPRRSACPPGALLKAFPVIVDGDADAAGRSCAATTASTRSSSRNALGPTSARRAPTRSPSGSARPGYIGPVGADLPILLDAGRGAGRLCDRRQPPDAHLRGVQPGRDFQFERADIRTVVAGDTSTARAIRIEPAIEVGNIFKLGTRYSEPLGATYLDESGAASS